MPSILSSPMQILIPFLLAGFRAACRHASGAERLGSPVDPRRSEPSSEATERHQAVLAAIRHW